MNISESIPTNLKGTDALGQADVEFPADRIRATADRFVPMAHMPSPAEYAGAYVFLLSREDHVPTTGCVINHDGGFGSRGIGATPRGGDGLLAKLARVDAMFKQMEVHCQGETRFRVNVKVHTSSECFHVVGGKGDLR